MSNEPKHDNDPAAKSWANGHEHAPEQEPISKHKVVVGLVVLLIAAVVLAALGILARVHSNTALAQRTDEAGRTHSHCRPRQTRRARR